MAHTVKITVKGVQQTVDALERYKRYINERLRIFAEALAEYGVGIARVRFGRAQYDGTNDVQVKAPEWRGDTLCVRAVGRTVLFIEFGTGVHYEAESHPQAGEFGFVRGGYGQHRGRNDSWRYRGEPGTNGVEVGNGIIKTHGNPANRCMYETAEEMRNSITQIAKEVFR